MNFDWKNLLKSYLNNPSSAFSVLILGEKGVGKTSQLTLLGKELKKKVFSANCASFSDDSMAESQLFGYTKGAFTGANKDTNGLFHEAKGGILFLDEIHHLSKRVQAKLMTALQTEPKGSEHQGKFKIRRLGATEADYISFRPVFASNLKIKDLKKKLLPDFYDRISQLIVEIPSIHEQQLNVYEEFKKVWMDMDFQKENEIPKIKKFKDWLRIIDLPGNYRTLQTIAINWHQARLIMANKKEQKDQASKAFEFVKEQFDKYLSVESIRTEKSNFNFRKNVSKKQLEYEYKLALYKWALSVEGYGKHKLAIEGLKISRLNKPNSNF